MNDGPALQYSTVQCSLGKTINILGISKTTYPSHPHHHTGQISLAELIFADFEMNGYIVWKGRDARDKAHPRKGWTGKGGWQYLNLLVGGGDGF